MPHKPINIILSIVTYHAFLEENLLIQKCSGVFDLPSYLKHASELSQIALQQDIIKILSDLRDCEFHQPNRLVSEFAKLREQLIGNKNFQHMILISNPNGAALSELYVQQFPQYSLKYCTTLEYAIHFLRLDTTSVQLEKKIKTLQHRFDQKQSACKN